jgi:ComF family protein
LAHAPAFNRAYTLYDYQDAIADLIKIFKFDHRLCVGDYFSHQLYDLYQSIVSKGVEYDAIIPMPLSRGRMAERGYNQVLELLSVISKKTNTIIDAHSVNRIKATQSLSVLNPEQRRQEIKGAFKAQSMNYQSVLLVDDVMTTGSSLNELTKVVLKAGVGSCDVLTLARAESKFN